MVTNSLWKLGPMDIIVRRPGYVAVKGQFGTLQSGSLTKCVNSK